MLFKESFNSGGSGVARALVSHAGAISEVRGGALSHDGARATAPVLGDHRLPRDPRSP